MLVTLYSPVLRPCIGKAILTILPMVAALHSTLPQATQAQVSTLFLLTSLYDMGMSLDAVGDLWGKRVEVPNPNVGWHSLLFAPSRPIGQLVKAKGNEHLARAISALHLPSPMNCGSDLWTTSPCD